MPLTLIGTCPLQAGPEIGWLVKAKMDGTSYSSSFRKTEFSLPVGVSFEPKVGKRGNRFVVDMRYRIGLSRANRSAYAPSMRNSAFIFCVGYKFSLFQLGK